jgi:hypothetical protein
MSIDLRTLIWLFPIMFMFHDFEEIIFGEPWLRKNADEIVGRIENRVPAFVAKQIRAVFKKSAYELAFPISLIFALTFISSFLAVEYQSYGFFIMASGIFFLHGFMHIGQAILLRRYVPAVISSVLFVIPYGLVLFGKLISAGMVGISTLVTYFFVAVVLTIPFILVMHVVGDALYKTTARLLLGK